MEFVGGRPSRTRPLDKLEGVFHFLKGKDSRKWVTDVPQYAEIRSERVYDGVEARWYFDRGRPRYDLIVAPGADPSQIRMRYSGANWVSTDGKELSLETVVGTIRHRDLCAYQTTNGVKRQVAASMRATGEVVSFEIGAYDRSQQLMIDPLIWSTYWGGNSSDSVDGIAVDSLDRPVVTGFIPSSDMPVTVGAYDTTFADGGADIVVAKFNEKGETLIWCTYLGGTGQDLAKSIALTSMDNPVIAGHTTSADFPTTAGAYDVTYGGSYDGVVSKLSADGKNLLASTYLGGTGFDEQEAMALDKDNRPVIVGGTSSAEFPVTLGSPLKDFDAFVTKLTSNLKSLVFSRVLGGTNTDDAFAVRVDADSRIYATGVTVATDFPVTAGAFQTVYGGDVSAYAFKLRPDGVLLWSSYLGGSDNSAGYSIDTDSNGNVVVGGETQAPNFPTTEGAFDRTNTQPGSLEGFVSKLGADGSALLASTLYGQAGGQGFRSVRVRNGSIFATGSGGNLDQLTPWGFAIGLQSGSMVLEFNPSLSELRYGSALPGASNRSEMVFDSKNRLYLGGSVSSPSFPLTGLPVDFTTNGTDGFVAKFELQDVAFKASPRLLVGGLGNAKGTVVLTAPAPSGGVNVPLSSNTSRLEVPESVTVPQGAKTATFTIRTRVVPAALNGMVAAKVEGDHQHLYFSLLSGGLASLTLENDALSGGRSTIGKVKLSPRSGLQDQSPAITVALSSSLASAQVPSSVIIPAGLTEATFTITTSKVAVRRQPVITATAGNESYSQVLTINP